MWARRMLILKELVGFIVAGSNASFLQRSHCLRCLPNHGKASKTFSRGSRVCDMGVSEAFVDEFLRLFFKVETGEGPVEKPRVALVSKLASSATFCVETRKDGEDGKEMIAANRLLSGKRFLRF
jgi:hypothetical protein